MTNPRIELVQRYLRLIGAGDVSSAGELLSTRVVLPMPGAGVLAGSYQGREAFIGAFARMMSISQGSYRLVDAQDWLAGSTALVLLAMESVQHAGVALQFRRAIAYGFASSPSGSLQISTVDVYELDPAVADRAFSAADA